MSFEVEEEYQSNIINVGIISQMADKKVYCMEPKEGVWEEEKNNNISKCTDSFKSDKFLKTIKDNCVGKEECEVEISKNLLLAGAPDDCTNDEAFVYVQLPCLISHEKNASRLTRGLIAGCLTVFVYLYTVVYFDYCSTVQVTKYVDTDVKTITAGDYTIEFDLKKEMYEHW
jgi:hypothetical protein